MDQLYTRRPFDPDVVNHNVKKYTKRQVRAHQWFRPFDPAVVEMTDWPEWLTEAYISPYNEAVTALGPPCGRVTIGGDGKSLWAGTLTGPQKAIHNDWIVNNPETGLEIYNDIEFRENFAPCKEQTK